MDVTRPYREPLHQEAVEEGLPADAGQNLALAGPVDPALLMPPGTVIKPPRPAEGMHDAAVYEPAATGPTAPIPYEKADRTPAALQPLEGMTAELLRLDRQLLLSLVGSLVEHGSVAMFGQLDRPAGTNFKIYRVVSFDARTGKFTHLSRYDRTAAARLYDERVQELS